MRGPYSLFGLYRWTMQFLALRSGSHATSPQPLAWPFLPYGHPPRMLPHAAYGRTAAFVVPRISALRQSPASAKEAAATAATAAAPAATAAAPAASEALFPFGRPPPLSPQFSGDARSPAALDEAKMVIEKEMWRLYQQQQEQQQQQPQSKRLSTEQVQQLVGFSRDFCDSAKLSRRLTATECVDKLFPAQKVPFDFAEWALSIWSPLIDYENSNIQVPEETLSAISAHLKTGGNVIFLSNHQTEPDPLVARLIFRRKGFEDLFERLTAVAGYRVRSDLLSVPFSMSCNMICVHSKKHLNSLTEGLEQQRRENMLAMQALQQLLQNGGALVWVAPSGGRDRPNELGVYAHPDPFDRKTVQSFSLLARRARDTSGRETLFCPMAIHTAPICPPPKEVAKELGEARSCKFSPIGAAIGSFLRCGMPSDELAKKAEEETNVLYSRVVSSR